MHPDWAVSAARRELLMKLAVAGRGGGSSGIGGVLVVALFVLVLITAVYISRRRT